MGKPQLNSDEAKEAERLYNKEEKTLQEIANYFTNKKGISVSRRAVGRCLKNVKKRTHSPSNKASIQKEVLRESYKRLKSSRKVAKELGVSSKSTILEHLRQCGISVQSPGGHKEIVEFICPECGKKLRLPKGEAKRRKYCSISCGSKANNPLGVWHKDKTSTYRIAPAPRNIEKRILINGKKMPLHRHIMEQKLGRPLKNNEVVHHIDMDMQNNNIENLHVFHSESFHQKSHHVEKLIGKLIHMGLIKFDREEGKYIINERGGGRNRRKSE